MEQYIPYLEAKGVQVVLFPFYSVKSYDILYWKGHTVQKALFILIDFLRRFLLLFRLRHYDKILVQRGIAPLGPAVFEFMIAKLLRKPIIYDFDDAIWMPSEQGTSRAINRIKCYGKVKWICRWAESVVTGNDYLAKYARSYNRNVTVVPTVVDTHRFKPPEHKVPPKRSQRITIGWTGSHTTAKYVKEILPALEQLSKKIDYTFLFISNQPPNYYIPNLKYIPWNSDTEVDDLSTIDIGIMPLVDSQWAKGKCGFKAIQYMALCKPTVVSPVGVNAEIVRHGLDGIHCRSIQDWVKALYLLSNDNHKRVQMGLAARQRIDKVYSVEAQLNRFSRILIGVTRPS